MPSSRRIKAAALIATLTVLTIFYISRGAHSTHTSPFYTRTVEAIATRQSTEARQDMLAEERQRLARVEKLEREHKVAMDAAGSAEEPPPNPRPSSSTSNRDRDPYDQKPIAEGSKSVAGRKVMADGKAYSRPASGPKEKLDGVAKVGNIAPQSTHEVVEGQSEEAKRAQEAVETAFDEILRKGPIIVFSKTFCPFSKKAKHILLDLYTITPPPYVVELDQHDLGPGLQKALEKMTGRRTVPNVLINGRSIGGGDDIEELHVEDKLISTISSMGGKRITKIEKLEPAAQEGAQREGLRRF